MIDAPAEIEKKGNMRISSTHGSRLSSLELQASRFRCGAVKSSFLGVSDKGVLSGLLQEFYSRLN